MPTFEKFHQAGTILENLVRKAVRFKTIWQNGCNRASAREFAQTHPISQDEWAIVCPYNIGDIYLYAGLARALLARHGGKTVTFYTKPQHAFIPRLFPTVAASRPITAAQTDILGRYNLSPAFDNRGLFLQPPWNVLVMLGCRGTTFLDCIRGTLQLPWDAEFESPRKPGMEEIEQAQQLLAEHECHLGKSVVICPDATTTAGMTPAIPEEFWHALVKDLQLKGYDVITNLGPNTKALPGTKAIRIPLDLFRATAVVAGAVFSNRNGLCDLVSDLPILLHVFYPPVNWYGGRLIEVAGLKRMGLAPRCREFEVNVLDFSPTLEAIWAGEGSAGSC